MIKAVYNVDRQSLTVFVEGKPKCGYVGKNSINKMVKLTQKDIYIIIE